MAGEFQPIGFYFLNRINPPVRFDAVYFIASFLNCWLILPIEQYVPRGSASPE
jgi:hypothetical protein